MTQNREAKFVVQDERDYDEKEETLALIASLAISQCEKQVGKGVSAEEFRKTLADYKPQ
jgi:hypothetical protein